MFRIKIVILLFLLFFIADASFGKNITKGTVILRGESNLDIGMSERKIENSDESDETKIELDFTAGYFFEENIAIGVNMYYQMADDDDIEETMYGLAPTILITIPIEEKMNLAVSGAIGYLSGTVDYGSAGEIDMDGFMIGARVGLQYFIIDSVSLDSFLSYSKIDMELKSGREVDMDGDDLGINLGFSIYFY